MYGCSPPALVVTCGDSLVYIYICMLKIDHVTGHYQELLNAHKDDETKDTKQIELDLHRTFPNNVHFESGAKDGMQQRLRRVLRALTFHNPEIGYCQVR